MPVTVKSIMTGAFANCTSIHWVDAKSCSALSFMNGVYDYSSYSGIFEGCTNLNKIAIGGISPKIGENMFRGCVNLESVSLPNTVERIGAEAFKDCAKLKNKNGIFDLPLAITHVGEKAFYSCKSLRVIRYPLVENRIVMDEGYAFDECIKLENILPIVVEDEEQQKAVRSRAISYDRYSESGFRLWSRCPNLNISPYLIGGAGKGTTYYIPAYMKEVDYTVVSNSLKCYAPDIKNCIFSSASERIGNECIKDFSNLERVVLNATSIESDEESETEEPETPELTIEAGAFASNSKINTVECHHVTPPALDDNSFAEKTYTTAKLIVPSESLSLYASSPGWRKFLSIESFDGETSISEIQYEENDAPVYYNIQGMKIQNPQRGLYIVKRGSKVEKIVMH